MYARLAYISTSVGQTRDAIAADLRMGVASVYRMLAEARTAGATTE
jgi:DNA-binding transcriptional regulator LsrR (DeoR family)